MRIECYRRDAKEMIDIFLFVWTIVAALCGWAIFAVAFWHWGIALKGLRESNQLSEQILQKYEKVIESVQRDAKP